MDKKLLICFVLLVTANLSYAYNRFVYLRYDESTNNVFSIQQKIQDLRSNSDDFVLFYNHKHYQGESLTQLLESKDFMTNISVYEPYAESQELSLLVEDLLKETASQNNTKLYLYGENDLQWKIYIIIPETASRKEFIKWLDINGFFSRKVDLIFMTYDIHTNIAELSLSEYVDGIDDLILLNF